MASFSATFSIHLEYSQTRKRDFVWIENQVLNRSICILRVARPHQTHHTKDETRLKWISYWNFYSHRIKQMYGFWMRQSFKLIIFLLILHYVIRCYVLNIVENCSHVCHITGYFYPSYRRHSKFTISTQHFW